MLELSSIKETVNQVAEAITAALDIETEIVDHKLMIIGGTGRYVKKIGTYEENGDLSSPYFYSDILRTGKEYAFTDIRGMQNDQFYHPIENEYAEIACPIKMNNDIIGIIGLVAFDEIQQNKIINKKNNLLDFLRRMADLISGKLVESQSNIKLLSLLESMPGGLIATNESGVIFSCNYAAENLLSIKTKDLLGKHLYKFFGKHDFFKDSENDNGVLDKEVDYRTEEKTVRFFFTKIPIPETGSLYIFKDTENVARDVQNMISMNLNTTFDDILGQSRKMHYIKERAIRVADSDSTVLLTGESGTGKGLFARAIHNASSRKDHILVAVNCGAIPDTLLESELFGYDEGAFTGASKSGKIGKFELANKGTIFLDEIGDIPLHLQVKLLDVLQNHRITRIGGVNEISTDVRVIAATNKDLLTMIDKKEFREDLYFRLNVIPLHIPPLRERENDIDELLEKTLVRISVRMQKQITGFTEVAKEILLGYSWPGNIRELENCIEYAVNMEEGNLISEQNLPESIKRKPLKNSSYGGGTLKELTERFQMDVVNACLDETGRTLKGKQYAAEILGISESSLYRKLRE